MVVLTAALCTKSGKALLARQFVEMTRLRVEGLLSAFPKLIASEQASAGAGSGGSSKQHTFVETDNVRYLYLPLEGALFLLLITNKGSNIVEDLDTLRLISRVLPEQIGVGVALNEESVSSKSFEILFALDEVVASGGYREEITLHQVRVNLEMESHEEKLAEMIKASKMAEAKEAAKRKAQELRAKSREDEKSRAKESSSSGSARYNGYGGGSGGGGGGGGGGSGYDDSVSSSSRAAAAERDRDDERRAEPKKTDAKAGMKLGAKKAGGLGGMTSGALAGVMAEEGIRDRDVDRDEKGGAASTIAAAKAAAEAAAADQATVAVEERVTVRLSRDGGVVAMEVKGSMTLTVNDDAAARLKVVCERGDDKAYQYQNHPNVNKALWASDGIVALKAIDRPFPVAVPVGVLRWRYTNKDDDASQVPLMLTCWPEEGAGGNINVNLEYTLQADLTLTDVVITLPLGGDATPRVGACDGVWKHNTRDNTLAWRIETINSDNGTGTLEFSVKGKNVDAFFPVNVSFAAVDTLCPVAVVSVIPADSSPQDRPLRFSASKVMGTDEYVVE